MKKSKALTAQGIAKGLQSLHSLLSFFNITNDLIVQQHIHTGPSGIAYFPMEGACQDPVYNTWHILYMRQMVLTHLQQFHAETLTKSYHLYLKQIDRTQQEKRNKYIHDNRPKDPQKANLVLLKRSSNSKYTRNNSDLVRQWDNQFTKELLKMLEQYFGRYFNILLLSDQDEFYMNCFACQAQLISTAKVLIGEISLGKIAHISLLS